MSVRRRWAVVLAIAASIVAPASSQVAEPTDVARWATDEAGVTIEVTATPGTVVVGDPIEFRIDVLAPAGVLIGLPIVDDALGDFAVIGRAEPPHVPDGAARRWRATYVLTTFASGETEVPAIEITVRGPADGAEALTVTSEPLILDVVSVLAPGEEELHDVADGVDIGTFAGWFLAVIAGGALVLVGGVAAIVFFVASRRRAVPVIPPLPAHIRAQQALDALHAEHLPDEGRTHEFFVRLTDIIRHYIEERFELPAVEQTTGEFLQSVRRDSRLSSGQRSGLGSFLRAADMVKFAKHRPELGECDEALAAARRFVETTAPHGQGAAA